MKNDFLFSNTNKRYHTFDYYLKNKYQSKVFKVSLNAGFSCPNRDGKISFGGCIFCSESGSGDYAGKITDSLDFQFEQIKAIMHKKWPVAKYICYFQAFTNTYGSIEQLKKIYEPFLNKENVVGISIATRADCLEEDVLNYLESLAKKIDLTIELGLQTIHDSTAKLINRGYPYSTFEKSVFELRKRKIDVVVHLINNLPNETEKMMLESVEKVCNLNIQGIKLHNLYILKDTSMAKYYEDSPFSLLSRQQYIDLVVKQLQRIPPNIYIERLTGDPVKDKLIAPTYSLNKTTILNDIDKKMAELNCYQGQKIKEEAI